MFFRSEKSLFDFAPEDYLTPSGWVLKLDNLENWTLKLDINEIARYKF
jgi:hypothetical protein